MNLDSVSCAEKPVSLHYRRPISYFPLRIGHEIAMKMNTLDRKGCS